MVPMAPSITSTRFSNSSYIVGIFPPIRYSLLAIRLLDLPRIHNGIVLKSYHSLFVMYGKNPLQFLVHGFKIFMVRGRNIRRRKQSPFQSLEIEFLEIFKRGFLETFIVSKAQEIITDILSSKIFVVHHFVVY